MSSQASPHILRRLGAAFAFLVLLPVWAHTQEPPQPPAQRGATSTPTPARTPPQVSQMLSAYAGQKVSAIELAGRPDLDEQSLLPLFAQHAGEPFSIDKVQQTLAAIKATGRFQDVQLSVLPDVEGVRVLMVIQPGLYFGLFEFPGARGYPYSRLLQVANYPPEGPFSRRDVAEATAALVTFFQRTGYFEAKVSPEITPDAQHGIVNVRFQVTLGRRAKFGTVTLEGITPQESERLTAKLKSTLSRLRGTAIRQGRPYSLRTIQSATTALQNALSKEDRLGAQVELVGAEYDPATNQAAVRFHVTPGPLVHVKVEGAHVWGSTQRKLIPLYQQVGADDELVQEGRRNLVSHFQSKGFFDATVDARVARNGEAESVTYRITRGPKHKVATVSIDGNQTLGDSELMTHVGVKQGRLLSRGAFSERLLRSSVHNLEATYRAEGFSEVKVTPQVEGKGGNLDVTFNVVEGPRDVVRELHVEGNQTMAISALAPKGLALAAGRPYSQKHADEDRQQITVKYLEAGYLTATFRESVRSAPDDKHALIVSYQIQEGPRVTTSSVITLGRAHTRQRYIDRAARFQLHEPLTTSAMLSAESRLYSGAIFDWAEVGPRRQITTQTQEDVLVKVHESPRHTLTYGFGFEVINRGGSLPSGTVAVPGLPPVGLGSNFRTSQKTFWGPRGTAEFTLRNILGEAETLTLGTLDARLVQRVTANFQNPSLRGTNFASDLNASFEHNSENPIYTDRIVQGGLLLQKPVNARHTENLYLRYGYSETRITDLLIPDLVPASDLNVRLSTLAATFSHDTRDNQLDATRGLYGSIEVDLNPEVLGSSVSFIKLLTQLAHYHRLRGDVIWANSVRLGFDTAFASSHVPLSQEFFSGGGSTIRGFPLNGAGPQRTITACGDPSVPSTCSPITVPEGGRQLLILNSEFRIPVPIRKGLGIAAFYDGGNVFQAIGFHGQYTNTVGAGLRYRTPVGPVRIDVGHNLNSPRGISATQFFITLGQAF